MVLGQKTIHICPRQRPFLQILEKKFKSEGNLNTIVSYKKFPFFGISIFSFYGIFSILKRNKNSIRYFHSVPLLLLLFLRITGVLGRHRLFFWGQDFYDNFLPMYLLDKSSKKNLERLWFFFLIKIKLYLVKDAEAFVGMPYLNFRWMRFIFRKIYSSNLYPNLLREFPYDQALPKVSEGSHPWKDEQALTVLIAHSGTPSIDLASTARFLETYSRAWNTKLAVRAFLSYSGGGELGRDKIEQKIRCLFGDAHSISIERDYLDHQQLIACLRCIDVAVFCVWRDEGLTLLRHLHYCGGKLFFPKGSVNLSYFKFFFPGSCGDLSDFLRLDPKRLKKGTA